MPKMALSREILQALSAQHTISQETDKLITRHCTTLQTDRSNMGTAITHLKQYTLWLHTQKLELSDSSMEVLRRYTELMNLCGFAVSRKAERLLKILKFLTWCKQNGYVDWDDTDKPRSKDDLLSRAPFNTEPEPLTLETYKVATTALARGTPERGFAIVRQSGVTYADLLSIKVEQLGLDSRLRITLPWPKGVIETPEFADREDVITFLNKESKLKLTDPLPAHIQMRALFNRSETMGKAMSGRYDAFVRLVAVYVTTQDPEVALFIELHAPSRVGRYKKCKWLSAGRQALAAVGRMSSNQIIASYRERLSW